MWFTTLDSGDVKVDFVTKIKESGKQCLGAGVALVAKAGKGGSKL